MGKRVEGMRKKVEREKQESGLNKERNNVVINSLPDPSYITLPGTRF
jgi:hypothetical protein